MRALGDALQLIRDRTDDLCRQITREIAELHQKDAHMVTDDSGRILRKPPTTPSEGSES